MKPSFISICLSVAAAPGLAADITVKMLNTGKDGPMAFEPSYVRVAVGDNVIFVPAEKGAHYSVSMLQPAGAKPWRGTPDQEFKVKIDKEGLYLYACEPHKTLGMVGIIQAGKPVNFAEAKSSHAGTSIPPPQRSTSPAFDLGKLCTASPRSITIPIV